MKIKLEIDKQSLASLRSDVLKQLEEKVLAELISLCDEAIEKQWVMFSPEGYNDKTGQLRSSTGYIIYRDGKVVYQRFELSSYGSDKEPGLKIGKKAALSQLRVTTGWGIVMVAGMEYASWVQASGSGRSVLVAAEMIVRNELYKRLDSILLK